VINGQSVLVRIVPFSDLGLSELTRCFAQLVGPLDTKATIAQAITFIPSFASLSLDSADSPASVQQLSAPELAINPLDLGGGYHSRAQRTKRFNVAKEEAKVYGKGEKKEAIKNRHASRKAAKEEELEGTNASIDPSLTV
jgi:hypothetical protein